MDLIIISHKEVFYSKKLIGQYRTSGGFPHQIEHISKLFSETTLICTLRYTRSNKGLLPLIGKNLRIFALPEPPFKGHLRHLSLLFWFPNYIKLFHDKIRHSDAVHILVPGDIGLIGLLISFFYNKPTFIRYCGTWGNKTTLADQFLYWLLPKIAKDKNIVMATGGDTKPPEKNNKNIKWIFSTSIKEFEWRKNKKIKILGKW